MYSLTQNQATDKLQTYESLYSQYATKYYFRATIWKIWFYISTVVILLLLGIQGILVHYNFKLAGYIILGILGVLTSLNTKLDPGSKRSINELAGDTSINLHEKYSLINPLNIEDPLELKQAILDAENELEKFRTQYEH